jgi:hypothetical protein
MRSFRTSKSTTTAAGSTPPGESAQSTHATGTAETSAAPPGVLTGLLNRKRRPADAQRLLNAHVRKDLGIAASEEAADAALPPAPSADLNDRETAQQLIASLFPGLDPKEHADFVSTLLHVTPPVSGKDIGPLYGSGVLYGLALSIATDGNPSRAAAVAKEWNHPHTEATTPETRQVAADLFETHCILAEADGGEAVLNALGSSKWWSHISSEAQSDRLHELRASRWLSRLLPMHGEARPTSIGDVVHFLDANEPLLAAPRAPTSRRKQAREQYDAAVKTHNIEATASQALRALHRGGPFTTAEQAAIMAVRNGLGYTEAQPEVDETFDKLFVNYEPNPSFLQKIVSPSKAMPLANGNAQTAVFILNVLNQAETYLQVRSNDPANTPADKANIEVAKAIVSQYRKEAAKKGWYEAREKHAAKTTSSGDTRAGDAADPTPATDNGSPGRGIKERVRHRVFMRRVRAQAAESLGIKKKAFRTDPELRQVYSAYRETLNQMENVFDGEAFVKLLADDPLTEHALSEESAKAQETFVVEAQRGLTLLDAKPSDGEAFVEVVRTTKPGEKRVLHARAKRGAVLAQWIHFGAPGHVPAVWQVVEDAFTHRSPLEAMILSALAATATINISRMWGGGGQIEVEANDDPGNRHITIRGHETAQTENQVGVGTLFKATLVGRGFSWLAGKFQFTRNKDGREGFEWRFPAREGESFEDLSARVSEAMTQLVNRAPGVSATHVIADLGNDVRVSTASGESTTVGTNFQLGTVGAVELTELPSWAGISRPISRGDTRSIGRSTGLEDQYDVGLADTVSAGTAFAGQTVPRWGHATVHGPLGDSERSFNTPSWVKRFTDVPPPVQKLNNLVAKVVRNMGKRSLTMSVRMGLDGTPVRITQVDKKGLEKLQDPASGKTHGLLPDTPVKLPPGTSTAIVTQELRPNSRAAFRVWLTAKQLIDARPPSAGHFEVATQTTNNALANIFGGGPDWAAPTIVEASATVNHTRTVNLNTAPYLADGQATRGVNVTNTVRVLGATESETPPSEPQQSSNTPG